MLMPEKIEHTLFAPCGINCMVCYRHLKPKNPCGGCASGEGKTGSCLKCAIKACASAKGFHYCFECPDFACKRIKSLDKSYIQRYGASLIENGMEVKNKGLECFMAMEKERWTCAACGGAVSLHDAVCSECLAVKNR